MKLLPFSFASSSIFFKNGNVSKFVYSTKIPASLYPTRLDIGFSSAPKTLRLKAFILSDTPEKTPVVFSFERSPNTSSLNFST